MICDYCNKEIKDGELSRVVYRQLCSELVLHQRCRAPLVKAIWDNPGLGVQLNDLIHHRKITFLSIS